MSGFAQQERHALCDTFDRLGANAPTLCDGWTTADLAAHLVIRERRPDAAAGVVLPLLSQRTNSVMAEYAAKPWPELVELVRCGPPVWSPTRFGPIDETINLAEFFVHHEDVLRAQPDWSPQSRRELSAGLDRALWHRLTAMGGLLFRRADVGLVVAAPLLGRKTIKAETKDGSVVLNGAPGELVLYAFGRQAVAQVEIFGSPESQARFAQLRLGL